MCQKVRNYEQAAQLYLQAAKTGHARAQASLAYLYEIGEGVPKSPSQAVSYYTRAARQGHAVAQVLRGFCDFQSRKTLTQYHIKQMRSMQRVRKRIHLNLENI